MKERRYILCPLVKIKKFHHHHHFFPLSLQRFQKIEFSETLSTKNVLLPPPPMLPASVVYGGSKARGLRETAFVPPESGQISWEKKNQEANERRGTFWRGSESKTWQHFFSISCAILFFYDASVTCRSKRRKEIDTDGQTLGNNVILSRFRGLVKGVYDRRSVVLL